MTAFYLLLLFRLMSNNVVVAHITSISVPIRKEIFSLIASLCAVSMPSPSDWWQGMLLHPMGMPLLLIRGIGFLRILRIAAMRVLVLALHWGVLLNLSARVVIRIRSADAWQCFSSLLLLIVLGRRLRIIGTGPDRLGGTTSLRLPGA